MAVAADLHIHTTASDGLLTPQEVVASAARLGLHAISVTDHDTVDGLKEAVQAAEKTSLEVIPGIELSTEHRDKEIHILGYYIDINNYELSLLLAALQKSRAGRAEKMVEKLESLGKNIEMKSVSRIAGRAAPGRPHIARALLERGYVKNMKQAFDELIGHQGPAYVERFKLTPQEAINIIKKAGGVAVWAHPGLTGDNSLLKEFLCSGLQGLEVYHPEHSWHAVSRYRSLAREWGLLVTGGSDYHGCGEGIAGTLAACGVSRQELSALRACR
ncbi:MAG: PHP domain-containing protein [Dethiobacter sp.]|jgi:predicted metal-dependent phosphoesterase TrpH|nr:PHP domain-containing protein [Dethiobacter sp.]